jgi:hypothetical protein
MARPTTIRVPESLLKEIEQVIKEQNLDRSVYLRDVLQRGFTADKEDRLLQKYARQELSQEEVCQKLGWDPWEFLSRLKTLNLRLNVQLEDWLDAAELKI